MPRLTVISLGGGVRSTALAPMAGQGAFDRVPDCAIFADTKWEPPSIYSHLEWLGGQLPFPLHVVDNGRSLREDVRALTNHSDSPNYVDIPVFLRGRDGQGDGIGRRQCTTSYKIRPVTRKIRDLLGLRPRQRVPPEPSSNSGWGSPQTSSAAPARRAICGCATATLSSSQACPGLTASIGGRTAAIGR